ncbi:MAG: hypothetical protein IJ849_06915 [Selenomonadaceae bacterium]|nr:hypothetical protein [Selenomonadaceae bacterium]
MNKKKKCLLSLLLVGIALGLALFARFAQLRTEAQTEALAALKPICPTGELHLTKLASLEEAETNLRDFTLYKRNMLREKYQQRAIIAGDRDSIFRVGELKSLPLAVTEAYGLEGVITKEHIGEEGSSSEIVSVIRGYACAARRAWPEYSPLQLSYTALATAVEVIPTP